MFPIRTILHPTDLSPDSDDAFRVACTLARDYDARLILLHVMLPSAASLGPPPPNPALPAEAQESLYQFPWPEPCGPQPRVEHRVAEGNAAEEILHLAEKEKCDVIVLGTHGRRGLHRWLAGSVAEEVLRQAGCPVLAVRTPCLGA
jgi:nucleotide-binding universal stress UspA family protein